MSNNKDSSLSIAYACKTSKESSSAEEGLKENQH